MWKIWIGFLSFCSFFSGHAGEAAQSRDVVDCLFDWFKQSYEDLKAVPSAAELERFFCSDFQVISNGVEVCSTRQEYLSHFVFLKDHCSSAKISPFLEDPIRTQDKVVIRYNAEIEEKSGEKSQLQILAILTLREGRIAKWVEVLNKTAPIYWE